VQEAKDMASPALEIAQKTKDSGLQLWAALLIAGSSICYWRCNQLLFN